MRHAKLLVKLGVGSLLAVAIACGSEDADSAFSGKGTRGDAEASSSSSGSSSGGPLGSGAPSSVGDPAATGVVIAHSASFPAFRLCFQNFPDKLPQPDAKVMPGANVVGVEIGSAVRIDPLPSPPGTVYVIDEFSIRNQSGEADAATCGELIKEIAGLPATELPRALRVNRDYNIGSKLENELGVRGVDVLAISGCGDSVTIGLLDGVDEAPTASCGTGYKPGSGNLQATAVPLQATTEGPTDSDIPVQAFDLAPAVKALGGSFVVKFGPQTGAGDTVSLKLGDPERILVDQKTEASYGRLGFEITANVKGASVTTKQTLADVQQLSAPGDVPTTYYRAASNYALLVLGDPSHSEKREGGVNPTYNPRRALHILAVPVLDPSKVADAGADAATTDDAAVK